MQIIVACPKCQGNLLVGKGGTQYPSTYTAKEAKTCSNCSANLEVVVEIRVTDKTPKPAETQTEPSEG